MHSLSASDILRVWEEGELQHPLDRALTILAASSPGSTHEMLAALPIGVRDRRLLALRAASFGPALECFQECPACGERLEFALAVSDLALPPADERREVALGDARYVVRVPNSHDLAAALSQSDPNAARSVLLARCVEGDVGGAEEIAAKLIDEIAACDPQADPMLELRCPACAHEWGTMFDIVSYLWSEICAGARRVLQEVHTLARAYGWSERDILSMTSTRRQRYLEMVS
jgi:hypothetical protein